MCAGGVTGGVDVVNIQPALATLVPMQPLSGHVMSRFMNKTFIRILLASLGLVGGTLAWAQSAVQKVTLDQAVSQVQADTRGKVLSAEPRHIGRRSEYRIKVLTPAGHVRVVVVPSESKKNPASARSTKNPPDRYAGNKEKR